MNERLDTSGLHAGKRCPPHVTGRVLCSLIALLFLVASGCTHPLDPARGAYGSGDYMRAYALAQSKAARATAYRQEAHYIAGMAAHHLNDEGGSLRHLNAALRPTGNEVAGRAGAQLGLIYQGKGRLERAVAHLVVAAPLLRGEDLAQAFLQTAVIQQKLGRWSAASANLEQARRLARERDTLDRIARHARYSAFAVQIGAFAIESNARRSAALAAGPAGNIAPRVVPATGNDGRRLYLVQIGNFRDHAGAALIRRRFGSDALVVPR